MDKGSSFYSANNINIHGYQWQELIKQKSKDEKIHFNAPIITFIECDFHKSSNTNWPSRLTHIIDSKNFAQYENFSNSNRVKFDGCNFSTNDYLKGASGSTFFIGTDAPPNLDLSDTAICEFWDTDISKIKKLNLPTHTIAFNRVSKIHSQLDLSSTKNAVFKKSTLCKMNYIIGPQSSLRLTNSSVPKVLDLSNTEHSSINKCCRFKGDEKIILPAQHKFNPENHKWIDRVRKNHPSVQITHAHSDDMPIIAFLKNMFVSNKSNG